MDAPNTLRGEITRDGPYHMAGPDTVSCGDYKAATCRQCGVVANPAHVSDGPKESLLVYCPVHCPKCIRYRQNLKNGEKEKREG